MTILRRERSVRFPAPRQAEEIVAVTYSTPAVPPRFVQLPEGSYRDATADELRADPQYHIYPKDQAAADAERTAILQDIASISRGQAQTFQT